LDTHGTKLDIVLQCGSCEKDLKKTLKESSGIANDLQKELYSYLFDSFESAYDAYQSSDDEMTNDDEHPPHILEEAVEVEVEDE
jgi:hypothetical protein